MIAHDAFPWYDRDRKACETMGESDAADIIKAMKSETAAWQRRDLDAVAEHWVQSPETRLIRSFAGFGTTIVAGWDAIHARQRVLVERAPEPHEPLAGVRWDNLNVIVASDMAWVSYDLVVTSDDDLLPMGTKHELKIFQRIDGAWRIGCLVLVERATERASCPLIEVAANGTVIWMNEAARSRLTAHPGLLVAGGRLRARRRDRGDRLAAAIAWASDTVNGPPERAAGQVRAVPLGEDESDAPCIVWVEFEDGRVLVSFDDDRMLARRIGFAAEVYGLSPAQSRLAHHLALGHELPEIAATSGVSVNTLRTQLQRIFDKTGVRNRAALARALFSADPPPRRSPAAPSAGSGPGS